jgi:hypothetical protein
MHQPSQTALPRLEAIDFISIFGLPRQPGAIHTGPFSEFHDPRLVLRFLALSVGGIKNLGANAVLALEGKQLFFQRVDVGQQFWRVHKF